MLTILLHGSQPAFTRLKDRLKKHLPAEIWVTVISFQEQVKGWMAYLNQARSDTSILTAYSKLMEILRNFCDMNVLPFEQAAQLHYNGLRKILRRMGTMDLRIASLVLAKGATLVTRNAQDFQGVPGLLIEDWTK